MNETRLASQWESMQSLDASMPVEHQQCIVFPDGHPKAIRLVLDHAGRPMLHKDGSLQYVAPWLLSEPAS